MFVKVDHPEFGFQAAGKLPGDDGEPFSFQARFIALGSEEQKAFDLATEEGTAAFLRKVLVGASDIVDNDKQPLPYDEGLRDWLIDKAHSRAALVTAYFAGVYKGAVGN